MATSPPVSRILINLLILLQFSSNLGTPTRAISGITTAGKPIRTALHNLAPHATRWRHGQNASHVRHRPHSTTYRALQSAERQVTGFIGDPCDVNGLTCVPPRLCIDPNVMPRDVCSKLSAQCFCSYRNEEDKLCNCDNPCPIGERCVKTQTGENTCLSRSVPANDIQCGATENPPGGSGLLNYEPCVKTEECAQGRTCVRTLNEEAEVPCNGNNDCFCLADDLDDVACSCKYPECPEGEKCSSIDGVVSCASIAFNDPNVGCASTTPPPSQPSTGTKFSEESCTTSSECAGERSCITATEFSIKICNGEQNCICQPDEFEDHVCSCKHPECLPGDTCSFFLEDLSCISKALQPHPLLCNNSTPGMPPPTFDDATASPDSSLMDRKKFSFEICQSDDDCAGDRGCYDYDFNMCNGSRKCTCQPRDERFEKCSCEKPRCMEGDMCGFPKEELYCISVNHPKHPNRCPSITQPTPDAALNTPLPTPQPSANAVQAAVSPEPIPTDAACVDAQALAHLDSKDLVFQQHALSRVLCDRFDSCATPGHMVRYMGSAMMMSRYCEGVGCVERVMEVNSPRYRRGMRVGSRTDGLEYTAFAARYGTRGEEVVLAAAIRVGL